VTGPGASQIGGSLTANGQVWLVNPNGVFFGAGSQVNVGGLLATTADIRNQDFLAGNYSFYVAAYADGGALTDLGPMLEKSGFDRSLYIEHYVKLGEYRGKMAAGTLDASGRVQFRKYANEHWVSLPSAGRERKHEARIREWLQ